MEEKSNSKQVAVGADQEVRDVPQVIGQQESQEKNVGMGVTDSNSVYSDGYAESGCLVIDTGSENDELPDIDETPSGVPARVPENQNASVAVPDNATTQPVVTVGASEPETFTSLMKKIKVKKAKNKNHSKNIQRKWNRLNALMKKVDAALKVQKDNLAETKAMEKRAVILGYEETENESKMVHGESLKGVRERKRFLDFTKQLKAKQASVETLSSFLRDYAPELADAVNGIPHPQEALSTSSMKISDDVSGDTSAAANSKPNQLKRPADKPCPTVSDPAKKPKPSTSSAPQEMSPTTLKDNSAKSSGPAVPVERSDNLKPSPPAAGTH